MSLLFLGGAILAEVVATISLRAAEGFSRWPFVVVLLIGYPLSFVLLSGALQRGMPLGVAYGVWCAVGIALVAILSIPLFGETLTRVQLAGLALVVVGIAVVELGATGGA